MNHFAHLVLGRDTVESTVGNLLGDFMRGVRPESLPVTVRRGLENHRAVDRFTDADEQVRQMKPLFQPWRRRFAGIALDIYFDHLLIRNWSCLEQGTAAQEIDSAYQRMLAGQGLMPSTRMRRVTSTMVENDWFGHYGDVDAVGQAIDRVARRIRFSHRFYDAIDDILCHSEEIEQRFLDFYPRLRAHVEALGLECCD